MACREGRIPSGVRTREGGELEEGCAQSEQRRADGGGRPQRRGGVRMKRSFPPRFYRERRDILTLSVPSKKGAFMHDRASNERPRAYGWRENGVEASSRPWGFLLRGGLA